MKIVQKIRPYTHKPGEKIPLPGTSLILAAYPSLLRFYDLSNNDLKLHLEIHLDIIGPVKEFTAQLDLTKGIIKVWGKSEQGFYRVHIHGSEKGVGLFFDKVPLNRLCLKVNGEPEHLVKRNEWYVSTITSGFTPFAPPSLERLSLGSHKSQDWQGVRKRKDLVEIFPVWYQLGQVIPEMPSIGDDGTLSLLKSAANYEDFYRLWLAGFEDLMCPRLFDNDHQGFKLPPIGNDTHSPLPLLSYGWRLIRKLFFLEEEGKIVILPNVPKEFHCGRLIGLKTHCGVTFDLEWTKKKLRSMTIQSNSAIAKNIVFPKEFKSFRIRTKKAERGKRVKCSEPLTFEKGKITYLDNFTR